MKKKKQPFTQSLIRLCHLTVQNPSVHKDSKDGKIAHKTEQLRAMNYPENTCVYPILRLVGRHSHQGKGSTKMGTMLVASHWCGHKESKASPSPK